MLANLLAISWEPELRGILIVIIAVVVLCGSIYLILATNIGARLGFLVALTGLFGWLMLMGIVWAIYGIGLKGPEPSWQAVPGRTVLQDTGALYQAGVFDARLDVPEGSTPPETATLVNQVFVDEGWEPLAEEDPAFAQASAAAATFLEETGAFAAGEFTPVNVFDRRRRAVPEDQRQLRLHRLLPQAALRRGRGRAADPDADRARPGPGGGRDRHDPPAPVRVHGPRPRRPSPAGVRAGHRRRPHLLHAVLDPAPP